MDFTGRPMPGYVFVDPPGIGTDAQSRFWMQFEWVRDISPSGLVIH
jgi:hypothetical protein